MTLGFDRIARGLGAALLMMATAGCTEKGTEPATETETAGADAAAPDAAAEAERNREILQRRINAGPVIGAAPSAPSQMVESAIEEFRSAQQAILGTDLVLGIGHLEQAVALDPEFGEAWFQLGEARHLLALIRVSNDVEAEALALERGAIDALRMARSLLDRGSARTLDAFDLDAMRRETVEKLDQLDPFPADDRAALARLRDLANEMASELPVLDEEGGGESEGEAPPDDPASTAAGSAATV